MNKLEEYKSQNKLNKTNTENNKNFNILKVYRNEKFPSNKFMNIMDVGSRALIIFYIYPLVSWVLSQIITQDIILNIIVLVTNIIMLLCASKAIQKNKKNSTNEFVLGKKEISAVFNLTLLFNTVCFSALGFIEDETIYFSMASLQLILYVGFTISLEELFDDNNKFLNLLCQPFLDLGITKKDWWKLLIVIVLTVVYLRFLPYSIAAFLFMLALFIIMISYSKKKAKYYAEEIKRTNDISNTLIIHIGAENAVTKAIINEFVEIKEINVQQLNSYAYDSVMFLSTTKNNDMIEQCINYIPKTTLTDDIIIFDPFVNKKGKRSFILSWLCLRPCLIKWQSIDEYKNVLK